MAMKILNAMFSKGLGGIEQVFLDYTQALKLGKHEVLPVVHPAASVVERIGHRYAAVKNLGQYDIFAVNKLRRLIEQESPHCIITHGNRATTLMRKAVKKIGKAVPIIAVCHNYKYKPLIGSSAIITITDHLKSEVQDAGQGKNCVFHVPNFIQLPENAEFKAPSYGKPPVIGYMGRLVLKKGVDVLIKALAEIRDTGEKFKCKIAGDGEERGNLEQLVDDLDMQEYVEFIGWVDDKAKFFEDIDVFCVPSRHEPFGIVLLEAFLHSAPIVVTKSEGPLEIIEDGKDGLLCEIDDPNTLAIQITKLLHDRKLAEKIARNGFRKVQKYSAFETARKLNLVVEKVVYQGLCS